MDSLETVNTFNVTFKTTNEVQIFMMRWLRAHPDDIDIISEDVLPDTHELYLNDPTFKSMVKQKKDLQRKTWEYIMKHNKTK
jgi:hypothetical protein